MQRLTPPGRWAAPPRRASSWSYLLAFLTLLLISSGGVLAQTLTNYTMTPSNGTFTALSGGTNPGFVGATTDDDNTGALPIGFQFVYMGTVYTTASVSTNGWLTLGGTAGTTAVNNLPSGGTRPVIAPLWDDLNVVAESNFTYQTTGSFGSRVFTAEWKATKWYYNTTSLISFQVKLYESNGSVQFVYSPDNATAPGSSATASVGITGTSTGSGNYLSLNNLGTNPTVSSTSATTSISAKPAAGQTYTFTAPAPTAPTNLTFSNVTSYSTRITFTDASTTENKFLVQFSSDASFATYSSGTLTSTTTAGTGTTYSANVSGLTPSTTYYYRVLSVAEGISSALTGNQATQAGVVFGDGPYTINNTLPTGGTNFNSFTDAINTLNAGTVTGAPVFNVTAGQTFVEVPPSVTKSGSAGNPITFQKSGSGSNPTIAPALNSGSGTVDYILGIFGADYIVFDGINLSDASSAGGTTTGQREFGYYIAPISTTDGAQYNIIRNCTVTLNGYASSTANTSSVGIVIADNVVAAANATTAPNSYNKVYGNTITGAVTGVYLSGYSSTSAANQSVGNEVGTLAGNTITAGATGSTSPYGVRVEYQTGAKVENNTITMAGGSTGTMRGIGFGASSGSGINGAVLISNNTVTLTPTGTPTTAWGINQGGSSTPTSVTITNNKVQNSTLTGTSGTVTFIEDAYTQSTGTSTITGNQVSGNTVASAGTVTGIYRSGAGGTANINGNYIGVTVGGAPSPNNLTGTTGTFYGIRATTGTITVNGNFIQNSGYTATSGSTAATVYGYYNAGAPTSETVTNNTITGLSIAGANTATTHTLGGILTNTTATATKTITGNTIGNLTLGSSGNAASGTVTGIIQAVGTTIGISQNKIYDLTAYGTAGVTNGITLTSGTTLNVSNNLIGGLSTPASASLLAQAGVVVTGGTTANVYNNTLYLNGSSTGATFGTSGLYLNSLTTTLDARNNIVVNTSTAAGTGGYTAALRRVSGTAATVPVNYAASANNNLFYTGTPSATNLIYVEGTTTATNAQQTLPAYKTFMSNRDQASVTENPPFASTTGTAGNFLHLTTGTATQVESGGQRLTGGAQSGVAVPNDYDGEPRFGETGYTGSGSAPDIGADEGNFTPSDQTPPSIVYTPLGNTGSTANRTLTVTITDPSDVATGAGAPRIYYKLSTSGSYFSSVATSVSGSVYTFTIDYANLGGTPAAGTTIQYYVAAQDANNNAGTNPSGGSGTNPPGSTAPTTPNAYQVLPALAGTYYVGSSTSCGTPTYATLTEAVNDYNTKGLTGAVTFVLVDNTYAAETYPITINANGDASSTNTLTIVPCSSATPSFSGSNAGALIVLSGAQYVTLDGSGNGTTTRSWTLNNTSTSTSAQLVQLTSSTSGTPASNNTVKNLVLTGAASTTTFTTLYGVQLLTAAPATVGATGNTISNNLITKVQTGIALQGISTATRDAQASIVNNQIGSTTTASGFGGAAAVGIAATNQTSLTISGNVVRNPLIVAAGANSTSGTALISAATHIGIDLTSNVSGATVSNNTVRDLLTSGASGASSPLAGIRLGAGVTATSVNANLLTNLKTTNTGGYGAYGIYVNTGTAGAADVVSNNMVSDLNGSNFSAFNNSSSAGIYLNGTQSGISVVFNSVNLYGTSTRTSAVNTAALAVESGSTDLTVQNNVLSNSLVGSTSGSKPYALFSNAPAAAYTVLNNNDYYSSGSQAVDGSSNATSVAVYFGSSARYSLTDVRTATTQDAASISTDPQFTAPNDLHTLNAALAVGAPVGGITTDFDGETRSTTAPYLGADEFVPVAVDAQPTALTAPAAGTSATCYSNAETVTVTVKNASTTAALDFAANPVTVTVTVNGPVTQTFTQTYNTNAANGGNPLAIGATVNLTLPGTLNLSAAGTYTFAVTATAQGDQKTLNDNLASQTRTVTAPALTSISASTANVCGASGSVTLTATGVVGGTVTWYSSADGYAAAIGTGSPFTTTVSATTSFRANVACGSNVSANSNVVTVTVTNPTIASSSASPSTFCGSGTSTITATGPAGSTVRLYSAETGGTLLATGTSGAGTISFTTPTLNASTTYYAEAAATSGTEATGMPAPNSGDGNTIFTDAGVLFTVATGPVSLLSTTIYPVGTGTVNIALYDNTGAQVTIGGVAQETGNISVTGTGVATPVTIPLNFANIPTGANYRLLVKAYSGITGLVRGTASASNYSTPSGSVTTVNGTLTPPTVSTSYYFFYNLQFSSTCSGSRTAIPVTVTPSVALTPATTTQTVCAGGSTTVTFSGYPTLSVSPTDGTVINGLDITFTPPLGTTTYTVTGTDGSCASTATVTLTSTALSAGVATVTSAPFCNGSGGTPALSVSSVTGQTSFVWQQSTTGTAGSFTTIAGSDNQTAYTAPAISATTYYQVLATCGATTVASNLLAVAVANPTIASTNSPVTRCDAGTVTLTATGSTNTTPYYYAAATGGQPLGSGSSYTATVTATPATQTFYVAARDNSSTTYVAGLVDNTGSVGTYVAAGGANRTLGFNVTQPGTLTSVDVYPSAAGSVNILVYAATANPGATGTLLATVASPAFTAAQVGTRVTVPLNVVLIPGSYKLSSSTLSRYTSFTGTYPYTSGPLSIVGSYNTATATTYTASTYNSFFNVTFAANCESARTAIDVNVTTPPTLAYTGSTTVCSGSSTVLTFTPASYTVLSVTPTTGTVIDNVAHTITFNPTANTSYTVTGNDGNTATGCTSTVSLTITVNPTPNAPVLSASSAAVCAGGSTTITATSNVGTVLATALSQDFNAVPTGWTVANTSTRGSGKPGAVLRFVRPPAPYTYTTYATDFAFDGTRFIIANADTGGTGSTTRTRLISPVFSLANFSSPTLKFQQIFRYYAAGDSANVDVSTDGGATWTLNVLQQNSASVGSTAAPNNASVDLSAYAGQANVRLRFRFKSTWGLYWAFDNVTVTGQVPDQPTYSVSPSTGASVNGSTITFTPTGTTGTTTYQVTASYANGCASPATTVAVTVTDQTTWTGTQSTDWFDGRNWSACVPSNTIDAVVPTVASGNYPAIGTGTAAVRSISFADNGALSMTGGTLNVYQNWTRTGTGSSSVLTGGTVAFVGTGAQQLSAAPSFFNLTVNKSADTLRVAANPTVTGTLTMTSGIVKTYTLSTTNQINLAGTMTETATSFVLGNVVTSATLGTDGASSTFGGIGLTLTAHGTGGASLPGATTVTRMTGKPMYGMASSTSIRRQFDIQPAVDQNLNVDMVFGYSDSAFELQGIGEGSLSLFSNAGVPGGWKQEGYTSRDAAANTVTLNALNHLSLWTLGSESAPLPVSLTSFAATRQGSNALLTWTTAQEKDNRGFEVQVSVDGRTFRPLGFVASESPNSTTARHYRFVDAEAGKQGLRYYRLRQLDQDGKQAFFGPRTVQFEQVTKLAAVAFPNPFTGQELTLEVTAPASAATELLLLDAVGRTVLRQTVNLQAGVQRLPLQLTGEPLPAGAYLLRLTSAGQTSTLRVVKH